MTSTITGTKTCTKCDTVKSLDEFRWRTQRGTHAPRSSCRACDDAASKARQSDPAVREQRNARNRAKYAAKFGVSSEIDKLVRPAARHTEAPKPPPVTAEHLADWYRRGCPL